MDGKTVTIKIETVAGNTSGTKKVFDDLNKESKKHMDSHVIAWREHGKQLAAEAAKSGKAREAASRATDRAILQSNIATTNASKANAKTQANEFIRQMKSMEGEAKKSSGNIQGYLKGAFGGGLIGGAIGSFGANIATAVTAQFAQIPAILKTQLDEAIRIAADRQNALKGLQSLTNSLGINSQDARETVKNLRLVRAGIIDISDASVGLKNLLSSGFSLPEATRLLEAFSDTAAFGKSAALSFGEAIRGATEGIRNGNSVLVDNVGLTKNLSAILKDAGFQEKDLSRVKDDLNVRQALYNGLIKEALPQIGDANRLTEGWTGSTAALTTAQNNLYAAVGNVIINNKDLIALTQTLTGEVNALGTEVGKTNSAWGKSVDGMASSFSEFVLSTRIGIEKEIADLRELINWIERTGNAFGWLLSLPTVPMSMGSGGGKGALFEHYDKALAENQRLSGTFYNSAIEKERTLRAEYDRRRYGDITPNRSLFPYAPSAPLLGRPRGLNNSLDPNSPLYFGPKPSSLPGTFTGGGDSKEISKIQTQIADLEKLKLSASGKELKVINAQLEKRQKILGFLESGVGLSAARAAAGSGGVGRLRREDFAPSPKAKALIEAAERLGVSPIDLATIISYETGGSFSPTIRGGKGNNYRGLIQFGPEEFQKYNVGKNKTFESQLQNSVVPFFQDRFRGAGRSTYGANILDLYKTVNGGNPNVSSNASDGNGTIASHVRDMVRKHTPQVLTRLFGGSESNVRGLDRDIAEAYANAQPSIRNRKDALDFVRSMTGGGSRLPVETSNELGINDVQPRTAMIEANEKEIEQNREIIELYKQLDESLFNVNERSEEEILLRKIKLGQYPGITEGQTQELLNNAKLIDQAREKIKADGEAKNQMEEARREQERLFEDTRRGWEDLLTDLADGNFKSIWDRMRRQMLQSFIQPASQYLSQLLGGVPGMQPAMAGGLSGGFGSGGGFGGTPAFGGGSGIGNFFQSLFGGRSQGQQQQNIQVPTGALGTGASGGSMWGGWNNIKSMGADLRGAFGGAGKGFGGMLRGMGGGSMMAGVGSGLGQIGMMAGSAIGGKWGNFLSLTGMGASIGANFGPWGAAIGAGIGAGAGLISMLFNRDNSIKKLKEAAASEFGISVKDKDILKQLKAIGEQYFGKGQAGKNAQATVRTEEGMNILRAYAESSGQSGLKIDRLNYGDENWKGNQFRGQFGGFRAMGGPVSAGVSYIVGERRAELFTPTVSGTISPTVGDPAMVGRLMTVLAQMEETNHQLAARLQGISPGNMLAMGVDENPEAVSRGQVEAYNRDPRGSETNIRAAGQYF